MAWLGSSKHLLCMQQEGPQIINRKIFVNEDRVIRRASPIFQKSKSQRENNKLEEHFHSMTEESYRNIISSLNKSIY